MSIKTEEEIKKIIRLFCVSNPGLHSKTEEKYFAEIAGSLKDVEDWIILETVKLCEEKQFYLTKNIAYFKGIVINKKTELVKKKELEQKQLSPIPGKVVW